MTWIQTYTGKHFDLLNPKTEDIDPLDICVSLAQQCRFSGHTSQFYSVAEHSVRVAGIVSERAQRWALLHDAAEAYIGDISRPMRAAMKAVSMTGIEWSKSIEDGIARCIIERFELKYLEEGIIEEVKKADNKLLATEARDLLPGGPIDKWTDGIHPLDEKIEPMTQIEAFIALSFLGFSLGLWDIFDGSEVFENWKR
jgi:uncharacterized protein